METLDLLGHHKNSFAGHFAPDDHNHRHYAQHQFNKPQQHQRQQTDQFGESPNRNEQRAANLAAAAAAAASNNNNKGHNSRDSFSRPDDASSSPPIQDESSRSQAYAAGLMANDCMLNEHAANNKMQYSSEEERMESTNQSDCYISGAECEPLSEEEAFIAFCADSSSVLNNDLNPRYHVNKLYQPLDSSGPNQQRLVEQDDEFLLYQELKGLCDPSARSELSKMLDDHQHEHGLPEDQISIATDNQLADCADLMGQDSLELTSIIDSIEAFESANPTALIEPDGHERASPLTRQFQCLISPRSTADNHDSSGPDNERSPASHYGAPADHCLSSFQTTSEADCYSTASLHMELDHRQHEQQDASSFFYQADGSADAGQPMLLLDTPSSRPSTCEQSAFQDSRSETSSVFQTNTSSSTPQPQTEPKRGAGGSGRKTRRSEHTNHHRRRTANARERIRMREINQAFEKLKRVVPIELVREASEAEAASEQAAREQAANRKTPKTTNNSNNQSSDSSPKLTKITTLRLAVSYISKLSSLLNDGQQGCPVSETAAGGEKNGPKLTNSRVTKDRSKRRSRAAVSRKPASASDEENKGNKRIGKAKDRSQTVALMKPEDELQKSATTPSSIAAFNDANGFKRIDNDDEKPVSIFDRGAEMKVQQPILLAEPPLSNGSLGEPPHPQTAYIAIPHHQNQKQQYLTTYQSGQQHQQHSMISQTHFNQNQHRLLVAPMPVAILVSNLVYINPMRQGVRQQQFCLVNQQALGSQQPQNGSTQAQALATKHVEEAVTSVREHNETQMNHDQTSNEARELDSGQAVPVLRPAFCQTKFVASQFARENQACQQQQQQQPQQQPQQIRPAESLESNINKLVASLVTSPAASSTSESQQDQSPAQHNHQQAASGGHQQPVRTYRFHNYDGNIRL